MGRLRERARRYLGMILRRRMKNRIEGNANRNPTTRVRNG